VDACTFGAAVAWNCGTADKLVAFLILGFIRKSVNVKLYPGNHVRAVADQI
jgi:hypothetical protein